MCHPDPEGVDSRAGKKRLLMLLGVILLFLRSGLIVYVLSSCEWIQEGNKSTLVFTYLSRISNFGCGWRTLLIELKMIENICLSFWLGKKNKTTSLSSYFQASRLVMPVCKCEQEFISVRGVHIFVSARECVCVCIPRWRTHGFHISVLQHFAVQPWPLSNHLSCSLDACNNQLPSLSLLPSPQSGTLSCHHTPPPPHLKESQWKATILICFNVIFSFDKVWNAMAF